jgi:hypothetical protein
MGASTGAGTMARLKTRSPFVRAVLISLFCAALLLYTFHTPATTIAELDPFPPKASPNNVSVSHRYWDCSLNKDRLQSLRESYQLGDDIEFGRRYVRFHRQDIERLSVTKMETELFPEGFDEVNISSPPPTTTCLKPFDVAVPRSRYPDTVDASTLLFGISTTYSRLTDSKMRLMRDWSHWLTNGKRESNGAGLILRLVDASFEELEEATQQIKALGINVKVFAADSSIPMAKRYLSLLPTLYNDSSREHRKFLVMCDDDTFFPSMHALLARLSQYDHTTDLYLGTLSEDVNNIERHGSQAFGGAGVFFSLSLAKKVATHVDQCSTPKKIREADTGWGPQGDVLLRKCLAEHTESTLTMVRELHQLDIQGDPAGFYESGVRPLSLHHFKGAQWHKAPVFEGAQVVHACGEACFLQRFRTADNFVISNGFSVAYYPNGIDFNLYQTERTFHPAPHDKGWNLDSMMGPQRKNLLWTGRKVAWELKESKIQNDGSVRQTYIRKADDKRWVYGKSGPSMFDRDGVLELIWTL